MVIIPFNGISQFNPVNTGKQLQVQLFVFVLDMQVESYKHGFELHESVKFKVYIS